MPVASALTSPASAAAQDGASSLEWRGRVPYAPLANGTLAPVCFIHYGGPPKNELMQQTIAHWRKLGS